MFFLLRSACCIGLVVAALPDGAAPSSAPAVMASVGAAAVGGVGQFCRAAPGRCLAVLADTLPATATGAGLVVHGRARPSRDTLSMADRRPAWAGPGATATN